MENETISKDFRLNKSLSYLSITISILGLVLNLLLLALILINRFFSKIAYVLIGVSTFSDILSNLMLLTNYMYNFTAIVAIRTSRWICRFIFFSVSTSYSISSITWCLIAYGHYLKVSRPRYQCCGIPKAYAFIICEVVVVAISCTISLPYFQFADVYIDEPRNCDLPNITFEVSLVLTSQTFLLYFAPSIFLMIIYLKIIRFISKYVQPQISAWNKRKVARTKRFMKMIIMITAFNVFITWPYFATMLGMAISQKSHRQIREMNSVYFTLVFYSIIVTAAITTINPVILFTLDQDINKTFKKIFKKLRICCCRLNSKGTTTRIKVTL